MGAFCAQQSFHEFHERFSGCPHFYEEINKRFGTDYGARLYHSVQDGNLNGLFYQIRGEVARSSGYHRQAVEDFTKALAMNPTDPTLYLQRGASYLDLQQYDRCVDDFHQYTVHVQHPPEKVSFSTSEFVLGFAKGLPQGICQSGKHTFLFVQRLPHTSHLYRTATIRWVCHTKEWELIAQGLSPELHKLITEWETLPSETRGELVELSFGKLGTDLVTPTVTVTIVKKGAQELAHLFKDIQMAKEILILEAAAKVGNETQFTHIVNTTTKQAFLGKELGLTAKDNWPAQTSWKVGNNSTKRMESFNSTQASFYEVICRSGKFLKVS